MRSAEGIFYSKLVCVSEHDTVEIDSRTSDAPGLAVRFGCPIYTYEHILDSAGILMEDSSSKKKKPASPRLHATPKAAPGRPKVMTIEELGKPINEVLEMEDLSAPSPFATRSTAGAKPDSMLSFPIARSTWD